jgi:hypothetical protein
MLVSGVSSNSVAPPYNPPTEQPLPTTQPLPQQDSVSISSKAQELAAGKDLRTKDEQEAAKLSYPITGYGFSTGGVS